MVGTLIPTMSTMCSTCSPDNSRKLETSSQSVLTCAARLRFFFALHCPLAILSAYCESARMTTELPPPCFSSQLRAAAMALNSAVLFEPTSAPMKAFEDSSVITEPEPSVTISPRPLPRPVSLQRHRIPSQQGSLQ